MNRIFLIFAVVLFTCTMGFAKEPKQPESYNYQRGIELIQQDLCTDHFAIHYFINGKPIGRIQYALI